MELDLNGGAPRMILDNVPMPNAFSVGPDGKLYLPVMGTNEIWRVSLDGGTPEKVAGDLGVPDSVKFDSQGFIISTQVHSGQVLRIDPRNGERTVLANLTPGLDNSTFVGNRLFVSNIAGSMSPRFSTAAKPRISFRKGSTSRSVWRWREEGYLYRRRRPVLLRASARRSAPMHGLSVLPRLSRVYARRGRRGPGRVHRHHRERRCRALLAGAAEKRSARAGIRSAVRSRDGAARGGHFCGAGRGPCALGCNPAMCKCSPPVSNSPPVSRSAQMTLASFPNRPAAACQDIRGPDRHRCSTDFEATRHRAARRIALYRRCGHQSN